MRSTRDHNAKTCTFVDDVEDGCLVEFDGIEMNTKDMGDYDTPFISPLTNQEVFYPGWCEW